MSDLVSNGNNSKLCAASAQTFIIRPTHPVEAMKVDTATEGMASITVCSSLLFNGHIDFERFKSALAFAAGHCPWMFCEMDYRGTDPPFAVPRKKAAPSNAIDHTGGVVNGPGWFECEYAVREEDGCRADLMEEVLPQNVHLKMKRPDLCLVSTKDLPVAAIRVTQFGAQFTIGYRLNHSFFDQHAIVYLFTFISNLYMHDQSDVKHTVPVPELIPKGNMVIDRAGHASVDEFDAATPNGLAFKGAQPLSFGPALELVVSVNNFVLAATKNLNPELSANDLITGFLLKALSQAHPGTPSDHQLRLLFARNMRKPLNRPAHVMGDYVRTECLETTPALASELSSTDFAICNRQLLQRDCIQSFVDECLWLRDVKKWYGKPQASSMWSDKHAVLVTNWTSFDYESIRFADDSGSALEILMPTHKFLPQIGMMVYVLNKWSAEGTSKVVLVNTTHPHVIQQLKRCADASDGLFTY
jgi:hypothetical protein